MNLGFTMFGLGWARYFREVAKLLRAPYYLYRGFVRQPWEKNVLSNANHFHCSCHATWLPCKTYYNIIVSISIARRDFACSRLSIVSERKNEGRLRGGFFALVFPRFFSRSPSFFRASPTTENLEKARRN